MKKRNKMIIIISAVAVLLIAIAVTATMIVFNLPSEKSAAVKYAQTLGDREAICYKMENTQYFYDAAEGSYTVSYGPPESMVITQDREFKINNYKQQGYALARLRDGNGEVVNIRKTIYNNGMREEYSEPTEAMPEEQTSEMVDQYGTSKTVTIAQSDLRQVDGGIITTPFQIVQGFLNDQTGWEIEKETEYLGRKAYMITGDRNGSIRNFEIIVDKQTGIILYLKIQSFETDGTEKLEITEVSDIKIIAESGDSPRYSDSSILEDQSILEVKDKDEYIDYFEEVIK